MSVFNPKKIFVLEEVGDNPITEKVLKRLPHSDVEYIKTQQPSIIKNRVKEFSTIQENNLNAGYARISKHILVIGKSQPSQFVDKFINTQDCYCPEFYSITPMNNGCFYSCQYCFLQMTYRSIFPYIKLNVNVEDLQRRIVMVSEEEKKRNPGKVVVFNGGEKLDSLSLDHITEYSKVLVPFFAETPDLENSRLLFVSKSANVKNLLELVRANPAVTERIILSWSINCDEFAEKYEKGSPLPSKRLEAAQKCQKAGYTIRLRVDPLMKVQRWKEYYSKLVDSIFQKYKLKPEVITLGSLRFNRGLVSLCKARFPRSDLFKYNFIVQGKDKERYRIKDRVALYRLVLDQMKKNEIDYNNGILKTGLCKEKPIVWKKVGLDIRKSSCNCVA
jgi:spore photoproduct lyase